MANTIATPLEKQFTQIPGLTLITSSSTQGNTNITLQFDLDKSIDAAATDVQAAIQRAERAVAERSAAARRTFTKTNPNDQPVMYIALTSDTLTDGDSTVRHHAGPAADQHFARRFAGQHLRREGRHPDQGRSRRARLAQHDFRRTRRPRFAPARPTPAPASSMARTNRYVLRPNGQIDDAEGYRNLIIERGRKTARPFICATSRRSIDGVQDERLSRHFFARGFNPPASVIVFAVSRQAGANAVEVARSVTRFVAGDAARIARLDSASSRPSIARSRS